MTANRGGEVQQEPDVLVQLREMILQGRLAPGRRITEAEIAETLGVSRQELEKAVAAVGVAADKVREHLKSK